MRKNPVAAILRAMPCKHGSDQHDDHGISEAFQSGSQIKLGKVDSTCDEWKSWYDKQHGTDISCLVEGRNME